MAYMFGFFFGKTPLIQLSPKKTWEGFIGGGFATVVFGVFLSYFLCRYEFFVCPIEYSETAGKMVLECEPSYLFRPQEYGIRIVSFRNIHKNSAKTNQNFTSSVNRENLRQHLQCIHSCYIPYHLAFLVLLLDHSEVSLLLALKELSKSK